MYLNASNSDDGFR